MTYASLLGTLCLIIQRFPLDFNRNYRESVKAKQLYEQLEHLREEEKKRGLSLRSHNAAKVP